MGMKNVKLFDRKEYGILYTLGSGLHSMYVDYIHCQVFVFHFRTSEDTFRLLRLFISLPDSVTTCSPWLLSRCSEIQTLGLGYKEGQHIEVSHSLLC